MRISRFFNNLGVTSIVMLGINLSTTGCESGTAESETYTVEVDGGDTDTDTDDGESSEDGPTRESNGTGSSSSTTTTTTTTTTTETMPACADTDADGHGDPSSAISVSELTDGFVWDCTDCDDGDATVYPGAADTTVNGIDNDCDGVVDDGTTTTANPTWYDDDDGDGYGDPNDSATSETVPTGHVSNSSDCDDADDDVNPGETEVTGDGVDNDCNALTSDTAASTASDTVQVCVVDYLGDWFDLYVLNEDAVGGDQYWFDDVFLDETDADGCRELDAESADRLKFNGEGETDYVGDYLVGGCDAADDFLLTSGALCAAVEIEVDSRTVGDASSEWEEYDLIYGVP